tara:strand:- start:46 stop:225 length:180 start_codon:yes stop_codon:yes gene_type:complete
MNIKSATWIMDVKDDTKKVGIISNIDGVNVSVPIDENNRHYTEILKQVKEGTLTIKDAE